MEQEQYIHKRKAGPQHNPIVISRQQRMRRVLAFSGELAQALLNEFAAGPFGARETSPLGGLEAEIEAFRTELTQVLSLVEEGRALLQKMPWMDDAKAFQALTAYDPTLQKLVRSGTTLEPRAKALREQRAAQAPPAKPEVQTRGTSALDRRLEWVAAKAQEQPLTRQLAGALSRLTGQPNILQQTSKEPPPPPPIPPLVAQAKQAFEKAVKFSGDVLAYTSPRLSVLRVAFAVTGLPGRPKPEAEVTKALPLAITQARIAPDYRPLVVPVTRLIGEDSNALRLSHVAVTQWEEALKLRSDAELLRSAIAEASPDRLGQLLREFNAGKLEAAVTPISHLHLTFRGVPHLSTLFPMPSRRQ